MFHNNFAHIWKIEHMDGGRIVKLYLCGASPMRQDDQQHVSCFDVWGNKGKETTTHEPHLYTLIFGLTFRRNKSTIDVSRWQYLFASRKHISSRKKVNKLYAPSSSPLRKQHRDTVYLLCYPLLLILWDELNLETRSTCRIDQFMREITLDIQEIWQ